MSNTPAAAPPSSSLLSMKTQSKAKDEEEKAKQRRKRGIIVMICQFLAESGFVRSLEAIQQETGVTLQKNVPADNVDLTSIFTQYEEYYDIRFGKKPKFFRPVEESSGKGGMSLDMGIEGGERMLVKNRTSSGERPTAATGRPPQASTPPTQPVSSGSGITKTASQRQPQNNSMPDIPTLGRGMDARGQSAPKVGSTSTGVGSPASGPLMDGVGGRAIPIRKGFERNASAGDDDSAEEEALPFEGKLNLRPLPRFETSELNELASLIYRDILDQNPSVNWNDVAELGPVKQLLKEAVVMPIKYPALFQGIVRPWHGILLFGPPGTGKTMLAKALATECRTTFFNVSAATIVSKWRGDSEKLVRMLFDLAVFYAPSTIFIDELDSIMTARSSDGSEHEGSRRMKTELLIQMDGLAKRKKGDVVFVLAASNVPWDLDSAMLRRLEKRICVGLPTKAGRLHMFRKNLSSVTQDFDFDGVASRTEGYSGADIDIVCREATMRTIRILINKLENDKRLSSEAIEKPKVSTEDVLEAIRVTRNATSRGLDPAKYKEWEERYGSTIS
jgi:katanin p60 ATPase-containing subunit A1